jgi:hypothetical protein
MTSQNRQAVKNRIIASIVLLLGGLYLALGISSFLQYRNLSQTFAYYGVSTEIQMSVPEIAEARTRMIAGAIEFPSIGILVLCVGIGLRLAWPWARRLWLGVVLLLTLFHVARLIQDYQLGTSILLMRVLEVLFAGTLAVISWRWLFLKSSLDGSLESQAI